MKNSNAAGGPWEYGTLRTDGRYLRNGETAFFWLGDTAWLLFQRLTEEEAEVYFRNRAEKGYSVIQATLFHAVPDVNAYNEHAFEDLDIAKPLAAYWDRADRIVGIAEKYGLYMGLLPHWGSYSKKYSAEQGRVYARFLAERFRNRPNVIWILGGDTRGNEAAEYWNAMGTVFREKDPERLICFHPFGRTTSIDFFPDTDWLDVHMFQSGHRRYDQTQLKAWDDNDGDSYSFGEDNWKYVDRVYKMTADAPKPVLDAEPSYENIPQGLHSGAEPYWRDHDVRRYAWWSVLEGACGFTYGHNAIMQFWNTRDKAGGYNCWETWQEALHHPGSDSVSHMARLLRSLDYTKGKAARGLLVDNGDRYNRIVCFAGEDYVLAYSYTGRNITLRENALTGRWAAYWMNPLTGAMSYMETRDFGSATSAPTAISTASAAAAANAAAAGNPDLWTFRSPAKEYMPNPDWLLVLRRED